MRGQHKSWGNFECLVSERNVSSRQEEGVQNGLLEKLKKEYKTEVAKSRTSGSSSLDGVREM